MAQNLEELIAKYLEYKAVTWAQTTVKSETARLNTLKRHLFQVRAFDPAAIYQRLKSDGVKPYTITTMMIRLADLENWAYQAGFLPADTKPQCGDYVQRFLRQHKKTAYTRTSPRLSYEEAQNRIAKISCEKTRMFAQALLETGLRVSEGQKIQTDEREKPFVEGKGGKLRPVFNLRGGSPVVVQYKKLRTALKAIGLKPHDLRKIAANRFGQILAVHELQTVMGWSSLETARSYLNVNDAEKLNERLLAL